MPDATDRGLDGPGKPSRIDPRRKLKRIVVIVGILLVTIVSDQITKQIARDTLEGEGAVNVVGSVFIMYYTENQGAFLGLGSSWSRGVRAAVFGVLSGVIVAVALAYLFGKHRMGMGETVALSLIAGGGVGNMIDRVTRGGAVSDFLNLGIGSVRTGVFNLADLYLMIGVALFLFVALRESTS